jgi:hypothetical protein
LYELKNTKNVCGVADDSDEDDDFAEELGDKDADLLMHHDRKLTMR